MVALRLSVLVLSVLAATALLAPVQAASSSGVVSQRQWGTMDRCAKLAVARFPDHTAEDLAKRDEFIRQCQRQAQVPVREGLTPR